MKLYRWRQILFWNDRFISLSYYWLKCSSGDKYCCWWSYRSWYDSSKFRTFPRNEAQMSNILCNTADRNDAPQTLTIFRDGSRQKVSESFHDSKFFSKPIESILVIVNNSKLSLLLLHFWDETSLNCACFQKSLKRSSEFKSSHAEVS